MTDNCNPSIVQLHFERCADETLGIATPFCLKLVEWIHTLVRVTIRYEKITISFHFY